MNIKKKNDTAAGSAINGKGKAAASKVATEPKLTSNGNGHNDDDAASNSSKNGKVGGGGNGRRGAGKKSAVEASDVDMRDDTAAATAAAAATSTAAKGKATTAAKGKAAKGKAAKGKAAAAVESSDVEMGDDAPVDSVTAGAALSTAAAAKGKAAKAAAATTAAAADSTTDVTAAEVTEEAADQAAPAKGKGKAAGAAASKQKGKAAAGGDASPAAKGKSRGRAAAGVDIDKAPVAKPRGRSAAAPTTDAAAAGTSTAGVKRRGRPTAGTAAEPPGKKLKLWTGHGEGGVVLTVGQGDTGQLGLGEDVMEKTRPAVVGQIPDKCQQICAGGMHTVCLTNTGEVYTFGCNDEGALGRTTEEEEACMEPGRVEVGERVVMVSAGDSHTAALTSTQSVYIWGVFRDSSGAAGMFDGVQKFEKPTLLDSAPVGVVKICSGNDHLVLLTDSGDIYTLGSAEQGQLGRVGEYFTSRGGRRGLDLLLKAAKVNFKGSLRFSDVWAGQYVTFAKESINGDIYAWGLNNYYQLGLDDVNPRFVAEKVKNFDPALDWTCISGGQHHTLALDRQGRVYSVGRKEYGRLGHGPVENLEETSKPRLITSLTHAHCVDIACGTSSSFSVDNKGVIYSWGMGGEPLGQGAEEEDVLEPKPINSQQLQNRKGVMVSAGGQHAVFLATDPPSSESS